MANILEVSNLHKTYPAKPNPVQAVRGISFQIPQGVCFGLLGPNGAGKTTTLEMIEGIVRPTQGEIRFQGELIDESFKQRSGIQFQKTALQDYLTVRECLTFFGSLYTQKVAIEELVELCSLGEFLDRDTDKLSGGQRQRVLLAVALVNDPDLIFLDEPTTGLDPQARRNFWDMIKKIKARKKTVVLTTHYMEEAYELCDQIAIMDHGKIIAQGSPDSLLAETFKGVIVEYGGKTEHTQDLASTLKGLLAQGKDLSDLRVRGWTLEDLFLELTGRDLREAK